MPFTLLVAFAAFFLLIQGGISLATILRDSAFVVAFTLFTAALRCFGLPGAIGLPPRILVDTVAYGARLLAAFLIGRLFYAFTSISELRDAVTRISRHLPLIRRLDIGLGLSMVISFIPLIFEEWYLALEAARSRAMPNRPKISSQALFIAAFLRRLMLRAVATPEALTARGWTRDRGVMSSTWKFRDSLLSSLCILLCIAAMLHIV
jgi:energy-coupling factor transporter transmembrane protein EcfT